jgi:CMP-N,N'-diacetyllegionaminic acid synthase
MISPVCPLVDAEDISKALQAFGESDADTLITCSNTQLQTFCEGNPVNVRLGEPLAPSQDNPVVSVCNWAVTIWDAKVFTENYRNYKGGYLGTKRLLFPIDPLHSVKVSYEEDFRLAEALILAGRMTSDL